MISFLKNPSFLLCLFLAGMFTLQSNCSEPKEKKISPAFYHWKNALDLSTIEADYLSKVSIEKLYVRFFDVDWQGGQASPISIIEHRSNIPDSIEIIPTVFITNRTLSNIEPNGLSDLADKILKKINLLAQTFSSNSITEVQFDCDWTKSTRIKYFSLLKLLRTKLSNQGKKISATIRLHQIKYAKDTGVPEVDRGVLMFYNMDKIDDLKTPNSILNITLAKQYLTNANNYPLPLDIALPIFKWGIVFQDGKLVKIINNLDEKDLQDTSQFLKIDENRFELIKSTYIKAYYLYEKDQIRLEQVNIKQLQTAADLLADKLPNTKRSIIFYHLDSTLIADYPHEVLQDIYNRFN